MKDTKKCVESRQLHKEDYLQEIRVELKGNVEVPSISSMFERRGNGVNECASGLLEKILHRDNLNLAYKRVKANKGSHGVDGMTVNELLQFLKQNGNHIRQSILEGTYRPQHVRRVEIPKPGGGKRLLGIPTVVDRVIQQAIAQILTPIYEKQFSANNYGFRPGRSAKQAVLKCKEYIEAGYTWTVDIDLVRYFDTVNHDKLMRLLSETIKDSRVLSQIRKYLKSGIILEEKLKLRVNQEKSAVDRPWKLKFLGFSFYFKKGGVGIRVHPKPVKKFKQKLKEITGRSNAMSMEKRIEKLRQCIVGWVNYYGMADIKAIAKALDEWLRRRIRMCFWKQWKRIRTKYDNLVKIGIKAKKQGNMPIQERATGTQPIAQFLLGRSPMNT